MKALLQRVRSARVVVDDQTIADAKQGLLVFVGIEQDDQQADLDYIEKKIANLRIFEDKQQKMNLSVMDIGGSLVLVSQFTLCANTNRGNRPSFAQAAEPSRAKLMFEALAKGLRERHIRVQTGKFGAHMNVYLDNDGPVTIELDSRRKR